MKKPKSSKLDPYSQTLADLEHEKKTLAEMVVWLKGEGVTVSISTLSQYLCGLRSARQQSALLAQIASGSRQVKEVEAAFAKNPTAELQTLIQLHRVMIMQLSTRAVEDPELLKLTDQLTRTVMEYASGQTKAGIEKEKLAQGERKLVLLEQKAAAFDQAKQVVESKLSPEEQRQRLKEILK